MKKRLLNLLFPVAALILELLPYGAVCNFANPEGESFRRTYSYFDMTPFGYANFAPLLTAIVTCIVIILLLIHLFQKKPSLLTAAKLLLAAGSVISLCPLLYGVRFFSVIGGAITACLAVGCAVLFLLSSPRAVALAKSFEKGQPCESLCKSCGFAARFN